MYKKFLHNHDNHLLSSYKTCQNKLYRIIDLVKQNYYFKKLSANENNSRKVWKLVSNLTGSNQKSKIVSKQTKSCGNNLNTNQQEIAEAFNYFFVEMGSKLSETILCTNTEILKCTWQLSQNFLKYLFVPPSTAEEKHAITMQLNTQS